MIKSCLILIIILLSPFSLDYAQEKIDFHSTENITRFADYLFCDQDYLRAYDEYKILLQKNFNDSIEFKSAISLQRISSFDEALGEFKKIPPESGFYSDSKKEYFRTLFLNNEFADLQDTYKQIDTTESYYPFLLKLQRLSLLYSDENLPPENYFIYPFSTNERNLLIKFYNEKENLPYKSPVFAAILSTIVPGLGKVYTENYSDGVFAAILTGLFGYVAYTDFKADHNLRGWIFSGVATFFYTGNIYGSAASAQIFNAKIKFNFETDLHNFLDTFHYLTGVYNFCR